MASSSPADPLPEEVLAKVVGGLDETGLVGSREVVELSGWVLSLPGPF